LNCQWNEKTHIILKYESLINKPSQTLEKISCFTSLDLSSCSPAKGDLAGRLTNEESRIHKRITELPDTGRIDAWCSALSESEIYLVERTAGRYMSEMGYRLTGSRYNPGLEIVWYKTIVGILLRKLIQKLIFRFQADEF
jgi:hypothetical protein